VVVAVEELAPVVVLAAVCVVARDEQPPRVRPHAQLDAVAAAAGLGVNVKVILTTPCTFCIENH
jgi:hypothetical protein